MPQSNAAQGETPSASVNPGDRVSQIADLLAGAPTARSDDPNSREGFELEGDEYEPDLQNAGTPEAEDQGENLEAAEGGEQDAGRQPTADEISDLAGLAGAIGVDVGWLYNLKIPMPEGREAITLGQFKDKITEIERDREVVNRQRNELAQAEAQIQQMLSVSAEVPRAVVQAQAELQAIEAEFNRVDWARFEQKEPGRAALAKQKMNEAYANAQGKLQQVTAQAQAMQREAFVQQRTQETAKLLEAVPEWRNKETAIRERDLIVNTFASNYGVDPRELMVLNDHRYVRAMRDLALLLQEKASANAAMKKVNQAPRTLRPVANAVNRQQSGNRRQAALNERAKSLGTVEAKRDAVANLLSLNGIA